MARRHLLLIGLPGSGKSTVGKLVAGLLDTHCTDIDPIIERATGLSVAELFEEEGELAFRERERRAVVEALELPPHVVAPGGGWASEPGNLEQVADRTFLIHLAVSPVEAATRLRGEESRRPLVSGGDPVGKLTELAERRHRYYSRAAAEIDVGDRSAAQVADLVVALARAQAGWG
jgi:shikimate kinase